MSKTENLFISDMDDISLKLEFFARAVFNCQD